LRLAALRGNCGRAFKGRVTMKNPLESLHMTIVLGLVITVIVQVLVNVVH
jgi:hypothetical protein